jgi:putative flippase GtrA
VEFGPGALEVLVTVPVQPTDPATDRADIATSLLGAILPPSLHRLARFVLSGIVATLVYFMLTNMLVLAIGLAPTAASVCAYLLSIAVSYVLQSRFTFRVNADSVDQMVRFIVTSLVGLGIAWCAMAVTTGVSAGSYVIGATVVCVLIPVANFFIFRGWVFVRREADDALPSTREP